jgi:hypothetical protein
MDSALLIVAPSRILVPGRCPHLPDVAAHVDMCRAQKGAVTDSVMLTKYSVTTYLHYLNLS